MANKITVIDMITKEALRLLVNNMVMGNLVNRQYSDYFANSNGKIGKNLRIRKPTTFKAIEGRVINDGDIQDYEDDHVDLPVRSFSVPIEFSTDEEKFSLDSYSDLVLKPAVNAIINKIDQEILAIAKTVSNTVGSDSTALNSSAVILQAGVKLDNNGAPRDDDRYFVVSPAAQAALVENLKGLFQSADLIGKQYASGAMGKAFGFTFYMDQNVAKLVVGDGVSDTVTVDGASQTGSTLSVSGLTGTLSVGQNLNIAGVYGVNPVSKETTGELKDFKVVAVNSAKTAITIEPAIIVDGPFQNVTAGPANSAAITFPGSNSGAVADLNLAGHKDGIVCAFIDRGEVRRPGADVSTARSKEYRATISVIEQYDIRTESTITKLLVDVAIGKVRDELLVVAKSKTGATA